MDLFAYAARETLSIKSNQPHHTHTVPGKNAYCFFDSKMLSSYNTDFNLFFSVPSYNTTRGFLSFYLSSSLSIGRTAVDLG